MVRGTKHDGGGTTGDLVFNGGTVTTGANADSNDRSQMLFACGIAKSDDNGEQEVETKSSTSPS